MAIKSTRPRAYQQIGGTPDSLESISSHVFSELRTVKQFAFDQARNAADFDDMLSKLIEVSNLQDGIARTMQSASNAIQRMHMAQQDIEPHRFRR